MSTIYKVRAVKQPRPMDPLHVGNFYQKERLHRAQMQDRQDLILYLAKMHATASVKGKPRSFNEIKLRLTSLRDWVYDYRPALDYFFEVKQLGYNVSDDHNEISTLIPKDLGLHTHVQTQDLRLVYDPGPRPEGDFSISKVYIQKNGREIVRRLTEENRFDLLEPVRWLIEHEEVNFFFKRAGKMQQRDTSVWPVAAVETWPAWLREQLFGAGIDIDSAYTQYLVQRLHTIYSDRPNMVQLVYPDLLQLLQNKQEWRRRLCEEVLELPLNDSNLSLVKKVTMSLANGSRISPAIMESARSFSITAEIIVEATRDVTPESLERIGRRLASISRQYSLAKKMVCCTHHSVSPTLRNQRRVFAEYFEWEREARYLMWEAVDRHGIMVHDGIDGVPAEYLDRLPQIIEEIGIGLTS